MTNKALLSLLASPCIERISQLSCSRVRIPSEEARGHRDRIPRRVPAESAIIIDNHAISIGDVRAALILFVPARELRGLPETRGTRTQNTYYVVILHTIRWRFQ